MLEDWNIHKSLANYAFENFKNELLLVDVILSWQHVYIVLTFF